MLQGRLYGLSRAARPGVIELGALIDLNGALRSPHRDVPGE
jgi:hypothetical protein